MSKKTTPRPARTGWRARLRPVVRAGQASSADTPRNEASPPTSESNLERAYRFQRLWDGVISFLEKEEPRAFRRLHKKLDRHHLIVKTESYDVETRRRRLIIFPTTRISAFACTVTVGARLSRSPTPWTARSQNSVRRGRCGAWQWTPESSRDAPPTRRAGVLLSGRHGRGAARDRAARPEGLQAETP